MILDALLQFSIAQALTVTAVSTNVIDLGTFRDFGVDEELPIFVAVSTTFTGGTSLQVVVQGSTDNSTFYTLADGPVIPEANLLVGQRLYGGVLPRMADPYQAIPRYIRLNYVTVGTHGAGALNAYLVIDRQDVNYYPPGIVIAN